MSKPHFVQFDQIDNNYRKGTGALPVILTVFAVLSLLCGLFLALYSFVYLVVGGVSCALLLAVAAIVRSIRNIEAHVIYLSLVNQHETSFSSTSPKSYLD